MEARAALTETCPCCGQERVVEPGQSLLEGAVIAEPLHAYTGTRKRIADFLADQERASSILVGVGFVGMCIAFFVSITAYFVLR